MPERGVFFISAFFRTLPLKICFFFSWMGSMKPVLLKNTDRPTISHSGDANQKYYIPVIKTRLFRIVRHSCSKTLDKFSCEVKTYLSLARAYLILYSARKELLSLLSLLLGFGAGPHTISLNYRLEKFLQSVHSKGHATENTPLQWQCTELLPWISFWGVKNHYLIATYANMLFCSFPPPTQKKIEN